MSKELTPLEVLKLLKDFVLTFVENGLDRRFIHGSFDTIEAALKENKKLKKCYKNELKNTSYYNNLALKYKKAFEILEKKEVNIALLKWCFEKGNCLFYNQNQIRDNKMLEDEEYELLKEVLKDE